jgi:hypothetical protein
LNVALSRAREFLVIIGSLDVLGSKPRLDNGDENPICNLYRLIREGMENGTASHEVFRRA